MYYASKASGKSTAIMNISIFSRRFVTSVGIIFKFSPIAIISLTKLLPVVPLSSITTCTNLHLNNNCAVTSIRDYSSRADKNTDQSAERTMDSNVELVKLEFEVFGRVQGVFFRKYTQKQGESLGLRGFCQNTSSGTVTGTLEGPRAKVEQMKTWLKTVGSPQSRIDKVEFKNEKSIDGFTFKGKFGIERTI